jgi:site-specific DNA-methyltransferase (adenine-specific)
MSVFDIKTDRAHLMLGDCLERMAEIPDGSIDMVLTDPPYGTTACKWDSVIDLPQMWAHLKRVIKPTGAIVMTAAQPFTTTLIASNMKMFKYCWVWEKPGGTGHLNANKMPMRYTEDICVFYARQPTYNPQKTKGHKPANTNGGRTKETDVYNKFGGQVTGGYTDRHPKNIVKVNNVNSAHGIVHPAQKPVALMEYLIKTYTNEAETVLDFTMGSGTTGVACAQTGRKFIGIERDANYYGIAAGRVLNADA